MPAATGVQGQRLLFRARLICLGVLAFGVLVEGGGIEKSVDWSKKSPNRLYGRYPGEAGDAFVLPPRFQRSLLRPGGLASSPDAFTEALPGGLRGGTSSRSPLGTPRPSHRA